MEETAPRCVICNNYLVHIHTEDTTVDYAHFMYGSHTQITCVTDFGFCEGCNTTMFIENFWSDE
jgi:hypothetical protein